MQRVLTTTCIAGLLTLTLGACAPTRSSQTENQSTTALPHSAARLDEARVRHLALDLDVDFDARTLSGTARLDLEIAEGIDTIWLDTRSLEIIAVRSLPSGEAATFALGDADPRLGSALSVTFNPGTESIEIDYRTDPGAGALQWLTPTQTAGGEHPFLFTQSQAILARTWVPCQDTPGARITYEADIQVPPGLMAVMSAINPTQVEADGNYHFEMPQSIPSYLLALAVGHLEFAELGANSGVYAEPEMLGAATYEFAETEKMIELAGALYGPYAWERYDILVLPPSFPFGGMENPRLTFVTPTIIAGDRSLTALIAHELAHSWSGNLVTNSTWNDFWLNEGFTTYFELRIMEALWGREYSEMLASLSRDDLDEELTELSGRDTWLKLDLVGRDPDDGMSSIAYDKGYLFLRLLEETAGREEFDAFLRGWFQGHAFESTTTEVFLVELEAALPGLSAEVDVDAWVYGPGVPPNTPVAAADAFAPVEAAIEQVEAGQLEEIDTEGWTTHHWLHFIRHLPDELDAEGLGRLDDRFAFTESKNSEIAAAWLRLAVLTGYSKADARVEEFLGSVGRRKFLGPIYKALAASPEGLERARAIYESARPGYHPVAQESLDELLKIEPGA